jgi:cytochrome c
MIMQTRTPKLIVLSLSVLLLTACDRETGTRSVTVEGDYRFAAVPAGLDSAAAQCVVCHSIEKGGPLRVAPNLWGIVGDAKARFPWYGYSPALATADGNWTDEDLDAYLSDPDGFLPGTTKTLIGIGDPDERSELIAFLKTLQD